ncbi:putative quinol monooxygenase [Mycolicibacterium sp. XJ1819]
MVIVAGHVLVEATQRDDYLAGCAEVVRQARSAPGCLDFALSADPVDSARINIFERWDSAAAVTAFRGAGPDDTQQVAILSASVHAYDVTDVAALT